MLRFCVKLISIFLLISPHLASGSPRLNFIIILVDDLGWMDLSCQGSDYYQTPNIDRLAAEGMRFTNAYAACAVCSPTRAAIQTGRYPGRIGVTDWIRSRFQRDQMGTPGKNPVDYVGSPKRRFLCPPNPYWMEHEELTIAEILGQEGYQSAHIGKWHLGDDGWYPTEQGYDENRGGCDYGQPPSYFDPFNRPNHRHPMIRAGIPYLEGRQEGQYLTDREADEAVSLIHQWKEEPFFIHLAHYAVHTPIQAEEAITAKYRRAGKKESNAKYAAMVESVDRSTGRVLAILDELGIADETVIIFTSDNGGLDRQKSPTENAPLRSGKGYAYEGGIRVPFIVRWPGQVPAGKTSDMPISSIDVLPTLLDAAAIPAPSDRVIDGLSLVPHLRSGGQIPLTRDTLIWHFPHYRHDPGPYSIIRKGPWKLIKFYEGIRELYHLDDDLGETVNLVLQQKPLADSLESELMAKLKDMGARLPRPNPAYQPSR
ncbi:MAG: Arylsulfatase [Verrucomicrobia subdivision 3 bacterium]|nr:Arylsulfatase [Limisphaerales bacterium]MCS1414086.1 Arylsulfatase [Limisphaerales bacterium]